MEKEKSSSDGENDLKIDSPEWLVWLKKTYSDEKIDRIQSKNI